MRNKIVEFKTKKNRLDYKSLTEKQKNNLQNFVVATIYFENDEVDAIMDFVPMTEKIFLRLMKRWEDVGSELDDVCMELLMKHPQFAKEYCKRIEAEIEEENSDVNMTFLESELMWGRLKKRIKNELGVELE